MFGIGGFEFFIILLFGFLIFGPDKLPELAKTVGVAISKFKKAQDEMSAVLKSEVMEASAEADKPSQSKSDNNSNDGAPETFAERKARYDKERAERKKQQQLEENRAAMRKNSAEHARELEDQAEKDVVKKDVVKKDLAKQEQQAKEQQATEQTKEADQAKNISQKPADDKAEQGNQPAITADQLYGNVPIKPASKASKVSKASQSTQPSSKNEGE